MFTNFLLIAIFLILVLGFMKMIKATNNIITGLLIIIDAINKANQKYD